MVLCGRAEVVIGGGTKSDLDGDDPSGVVHPLVVLVGDENNNYIRSDAELDWTLASCRR
jgi:hypothetical protein